VAAVIVGEDVVAVSAMVKVGASVLAAGAVAPAVVAVSLGVGCVVTGFVTAVSEVTSVGDGEAFESPEQEAKAARHASAISSRLISISIRFGAGRS
jgi:hypothetical protein